MIPSEVIDPGELPTRLLEITRSEDDTIVRLQEMRTMSEKEKALAASSGFAILSYCWGKTGNPIRLTAGTQGELKKGIPLCTLPKTIQHAIGLIMNMSSLQFVCIDALCILQDDDEDKGREIARMGSYYGSSTVTISAASAADTSEGLLRDPGTSLRYGYGPIQVACTAGSQKGHVFLTPKSPDAICEEPITKRAWTMQESLLSRRILIFSGQLYWCCVSSYAECGGRYQTLSRTSNRNMGMPMSLVPDIYPAACQRDIPPQFAWKKGVFDFTSRNLSFSGDRLHAISAFASHIHDLFRVYGFEGDHNIMYVSGLFLTTNKMFLSLSQLLWKASPLPLERVNGDLAPSWSWATVDGQVEFPSLWHDMVVTNVTNDQSRFLLMDVGVELKRSNEPYGNVKQALLHFRGFVRPLKSLMNISQSLTNTIESFDADQREGTLIMLGDTSSDSATIRDGTNGRNTTQIFILGLVNEVLEPSSSRPPRPGLGLVVCQQDSVARIPIFRRLGRYKYIQAGTTGIFSDVDYIEGNIG